MIITKQTVCEALTPKEVRDVIRRLNLPIGHGITDIYLAKVLAGHPGAHVRDILECLTVRKLKEVCRALDLRGVGRTKASIVQHIDNAVVPTQRVLYASADNPIDTYAAPTHKPRSASLGFEPKLWEAANLLRNSMDPAVYKHVILGLIFIKYISDTFEGFCHSYSGGVRDSSFEENIFWVPRRARWSYIESRAHHHTITHILDEAMGSLENANPRLNSVLPKNYAGSELDKVNLGKLIELVGTIGFTSEERGEKDVLGRVYEYMIARFASSEGKGGGEFYTPESVVRVLVEMLEPYEGKVYDPCCGSGGMFVQSVNFVEAHNSFRDRVSVYGQESNPTTLRLARMNLAIRGIEANLGTHHANSFLDDQHPDLRADYVLANPPFNIKNWGGEQLTDDPRWRFGTPPVNNANFAWVQHILHHLTPQGLAGFVLSNSSMASTQSGEDTIRRNLIETDLVDCIVTLPSRLFYATQIPVCLWFLSNDKSARRHFRDHRRQTLFIDARELGEMETKVHRVLTVDDIYTIANTYHQWRNVDGTYEDILGFCKATSTEDIASKGYLLTPARYVGFRPREKGEDFGLKMKRLIGDLHEQTQHAKDLDAQLRDTLEPWE